MNEHRPVAGSSGSGREANPVREARLRPSLATLLAEAGVASEDQLRLATAEGMGSGERLGEIVLRRGWIDEQGLAQVLARQWRLPFLANEAARLEPQAPRLLPAELARALAGCPVEAAAPLVAVAEPSEERFASMAAAIGDLELGFAVVTPGTLARLWDELERAERDMTSDSEHEVAEEAAEAELTEPLAAAIEEATRAVAALRGQVADLSERRQREKAELERYRERLAQLEDERTQSGEERQRLEEALGQQRVLLATLRERLAEAQALLEEG
jgi:Type II secretion system (T2SS), protein E, N-terminal domain